MKRLFYALVLFSLVGLFLVACSSTASASGETLTNIAIPEKQVTVEAVAIDEEPIKERVSRTDEPETSSSSIAHLLPLMRQVTTSKSSGQLVIINYTGYEITLLDIFSDNMYEENNNLGNLISYGVGSEDSITIVVEEYPDLLQSILGETGEIFHINAMDSEGSSYYKEWLPLVDEWEIELTHEDLNYYPSLKETAVVGESMLVSNNSSYIFDQLYIRNEKMAQGQEMGPNLLPSDFLPGHTARIEMKDIPWIDSTEESTFLLVAFDTEGDFYTKEWTPEDSNWHLGLTLSDLYRLPSAQFLPLETLLVLTNNTEKDLWYVYLPTESMANEDNLGDDLFSINVLEQGESMQFDLVYFPSTWQAYQSSDDPLFIVIAYDSDDGLYKRLWKPSKDGWEVVFTPDDYIAE